jgi:hypothetical protein
MILAPTHRPQPQAQAQAGVARNSSSNNASGDKEAT